MRLQKYMAEAGVASRRKCEEYISDGRVKVNGQVVTEMGVTVEPGADRVDFDGHRLSVEAKVYILFYKPPHVMCTNSDPEGRVTVMDYFQDADMRLFTVGRLDFDSEGLIMLTNDGEFANRMTHPRHGVPKTYFTVCRGAVEREELDSLRAGIVLDDGERTGKCAIKLLKKTENDSTLLVEIREGKNRQIRRMFDAVGHEVLFLRREKIGVLTIGGLKSGKWRYITPEELEQLNRECRV